MSPITPTSGLFHSGHWRQSMNSSTTSAYSGNLIKTSTCPNYLYSEQMQSESDSSGKEVSVWKRFGQLMRKVGDSLKDTIGIIAVGLAGLLAIFFAGGFLKERAGIKPTQPEN